MGSWLDINGEAIYGTRKWNGTAENKQENIFFTQKGNDLYVICTEWPGESVTVNGISKRGDVKMLGLDFAVKTKKSGSALVISTPEINPANNPSPYAWVFKIENVL
ncbi:MAG TPA: alpha-L-fucosidase C-terminal domain-containing protein [Tangfeifania sp.]|nr:alpha-L-fucosidase C-terminal domain-containing protein [Tangfeifania sp.]